MTALRASNHNKNSSFGGGTLLLACLILTTGMAFAAQPVEAAHALARDGKVIKAETKSTTEVAVKDPEATGSIQPSDDSLNCSQSRKRLFVEGEGWIVRRVTTCY
jgi:hypothetical protein